jgi:hypothetical protein
VQYSLIVQHSLLGLQAIDLFLVHLIVGKIFRIQFYVVQSDDLHEKSYWQPLFDPKQAFFSTS